MKFYKTIKRIVQLEARFFIFSISTFPVTYLIKTFYNTHQRHEFQLT